jgi:hypothetical protein
MRRNTKPVVTRHLSIFEDDWNWLSLAFGKQGGARPIGVAKVIQMLVHREVKRMRQQVSDGTDQPGRSGADA